jgi:acetate kinase
VPTALHTAGAWLRDEQRVEPSAVGHRVVHGGPDYSSPILVTPEVLTRLERYVPLAPLHQPHNLAPIRSILTNLPQLPQVACFDTAFHREHAAVADHFAIPQDLYAEGVRRYGFHGLSYEYVASCLPKVAPESAAGRVIVAHLGSGASMCALSGGRSIESTMGFTALDGLPMGTRPGQIDPGVILYLIEQKKMSAAALQALSAAAPAITLLLGSATFAQTPPAPTNTLVTIGAGNKFQKVLGSSATARRMLRIGNNNTNDDICWVFVGKRPSVQRS